MKGRQVALALVAVGEEPPSEFRIFTAGVVDTAKGKFTFDAKAAASVIADYKAHGTELMVDYDHASVGGAPFADPAQAGKAAGWFDLELRGGELWAVNVRWTEPAAEALRRKEWRYMSPAFATDDAGRITSLLNVALTNLPATNRLSPLMAASLVALGGSMTSDQAKQALQIVADGDANAALQLLIALLATEASDDPGDGTPPADGADGGGAVPPPEAMAGGACPPGSDKEQQASIAAAISRLTRITEKDTLVGAVDEVEVWRQSHLRLEAETTKLAQERAALELGKRKENAIAFTKLGAETPHTTGLAKGKLCKRLLEEPLEEQTARVAALLAARGGKMPDAPTPPAGGGTAAAGSKEFETPDGPVTLSAAELAKCAAKKIDPAKYAAQRAAIQARSNQGV